MKLIYKLYSYPQLHLYAMHTWPLLSWGSSWNSRINLRHPQAMVGWVLQELYLSLSCQSCRTTCATPCSLFEAYKPASLETCDDMTECCVYNCSNLTFEPSLNHVVDLILLALGCWRFICESFHRRLSHISQLSSLFVFCGRLSVYGVLPMTYRWI